MEQELERLEGTVEDIIYLNEDNGYTVFEVSGGGVVTVVCGVVGELHAGESVVCRGRYENHATYGRQFHAQECETDMPKDLEAVYAFLASRSLPYIGARTADKIIDKFGAAALEVIANDPAQLTLIPGISADKADRIQQEFKRMFGMRELIAYLAQFEISPRRAMEVFRTFGPGAMQAIQQNPYLLCGEPLQLDFRHADSIAQYYQMAGDCAQRLEAALLRTLRHNAGNGHTCLPRAQLLETASNFIHQPPEKLAAALDSCIQTGKLAVRMFDGTPYIYLPDLLEAEEDIAARLAMLTKRGKNTAHGLDKNIQILELTQGFAYAPLQKEAIRKAMTENCLVLTGGPGTGKTTTVNAILQLLENQGILAERKSIYSDIDTLRSLGYDIQLRRGRGGGYWLASRTFELSELKLLVDAVQASKVVSARTSSKLIHKLEALCSDYEGTQLQRQVYVDGRPKSDSHTLLYSIDALHTAINRGCLVQFRYKGSSAVRTVSPWQLAWENGCYYLIAYQDEKAPPVRHYRVDRMAGVLVLDEPRRGKEFFRTFDLPAYLRKHFNMFGGTEYRVTLRCTADLEPVMRERFGREPVFCPEDAEHFHFDVPICVSQQFFGWVCGFGGKVEVTAPAAVRAQLHEMVQSLAEQHE